MTADVAWGDPPEVGERKWAGFHVADLLLVASLGFVALSFVLGVISYFIGPEGVETSPAALWFGVSVNFVVFAALPMAWVAVTVHGGWEGVRRYLGMHGGFGEAAIGAGMGVVLVIVLGGLALVLEQLGWTPESAPIEDLLRNVTWPLAIAFSAVAGFGEEVLFRGILQRWLGWWGQGLVFGALHFANAGLFAFLVVGSIGLLFGYLRHRGFSLWTLIVAHFVYDFILLAAVILFPEAATGGTAL